MIIERVAASDVTSLAPDSVRLWEINVNESNRQIEVVYSHSLGDNEAMPKQNKKYIQIQIWETKTTISERWSGDKI